MKLVNSCVLLIYGMCLVGCEKQHKPMDTAVYITQLSKALDEAIVNDFFSPPVASRIYANTHLTTLYCLHQTSPDSTSALELLARPVPHHTSDETLEIVALYAASHVAQQLVFDARPLINYDSVLSARLLSCNYDPVQINAIRDSGYAFGTRMFKWISGDGYPQTRTAMKYSLIEADSAWQPTPIHFMDALEPHWGELRTFLPAGELETVQHRPLRYQSTEGSEFQEELRQVEWFVDSLNAKDSAIARFWDCNPLVISIDGHVNSSIKQLTPAGHWMSIQRQLSIHSSFQEIAHRNALLSCVLYDSFVYCWKLKYQYQLVRPITLIRKYSNPKWECMIQTPNFPEYPSGHSVISGAAAVVLSSIYGETMPYTDSTELQYGHSIRHYSSFDEAAQEAALSRFYAGIHYKYSVLEGLKIGQQIAGRYLLIIGNHDKK